MSANYITDLNATTQTAFSLGAGNLSPSGQLCGLSGIIVGQSFYMGNANSFCNVWVAGADVTASGVLGIKVQCSDSDTSGNYTDPTSGLAQLPTVFSSGGIIWLGSGVATGSGGIYGGFASGFALQSGFLAFAGFQRTGTFARLMFLSGFYCGPLQAGFVSQLRTTGSGGGFSYQPGSGVVSV